MLVTMELSVYSSKYERDIIVFWSLQLLSKENTREGELT